MAETPVEEKEKVSRFRRQFQTLTDALFKRRHPPVETDFLRRAIAEFGVDEWTKGPIDARLLRGMSLEGRRFQSISHAASHLGIMPSTARRLAADGTLRMTAIKTGKSRRFIGETTTEPLLKKAGGRTLGIRAAAALIGIPVSVLRALRSSGYYEAVHLATPRAGFHERDLMAFNEKCLTVVEPGGVLDDPISLGQVLRTFRTWNGTGKCDLVIAVLEGKVKSVDDSGQWVGDIKLEKAEVGRFLADNRFTQEKGSRSVREAMKFLQCSAAAIPALVEQGRLAGVQCKSGLRITQKSLDAFNATFVRAAEVALSKNTSPKRVVGCCQNSGIGMVVARSVEGRALQHFIRREDVDKIQWVPTRKATTAVKPRAVPPDPLQLLQRYFDELRRGGGALPRRCRVPNKITIAKACGIDRSVFYSNADAISLLETFDVEDRERALIEKRDDAGSLRGYLAGLVQKGVPIPQSASGKLNKFAIAAACGFHRNVLYRDKAMMAILAEFTGGIAAT
jgi:hypothetical protein